MKLRQNGTVSFLIRLAAFQASGGARVKLHESNAIFRTFYVSLTWERGNALKFQIKITFPARKVKVGFGNWILGFEIYLKFGACNL